MNRRASTSNRKAEPELFDLPFLSSDPDLLNRVKTDAEYARVLKRDLTSEARSRNRKHPTMCLLTAAEQRALDRATIDGAHATGPSSMDRADHGVARAMERTFGSLLAMRVLVLCGTGNNGDGYVAARYPIGSGARAWWSWDRAPGSAGDAART